MLKETNWFVSCTADMIPPHWPIFHLICEKHRLGRTWIDLFRWICVAVCPDGITIHFLTWIEMKVEWPLPSHNWGPDSNEEKRCLTKKSISEWWGVLEAVSCFPCQIRPMILFKEVKAWCNVVVGPCQMDRHMALVLLFRCSVCRVTPCNAQVL